jgi:hypothetical protein
MPVAATISKTREGWIVKTFQPVQLLQVIGKAIGRKVLP